jgi:hypothetical protein
MVCLLCVVCRAERRLGECVLGELVACLPWCLWYPSFYRRQELLFGSLKLTSWCCFYCLLFQVIGSDTSYYCTSLTIDIIVVCGASNESTDIFKLHHILESKKTIVFNEERASWKKTELFQQWINGYYSISLNTPKGVKEHDMMARLYIC